MEKERKTQRMTNAIINKRNSTTTSPKVVLIEEVANGNDDEYDGLNGGLLWSHMHIGLRNV